MALPRLPAPIEEVIPYLASSKGTMQEALEPYREYESALREIYAQDRDNSVLNTPNVNIVPIFNGHEKEFLTRARDLKSESQEVKDKYMLPLPDEDRREDKSPAIASSLKEFKTNFNVFSESSLADLEWDNVVVAGSAAVTSLLPVPKKHGESKRALRAYYHELLAPASDVDLFLYGLEDEEAAKKKIDQIEKSIRDSILYETTTIRTKYAITIASQHPCRHVQIVLRLYKNLSEILTSFDVDSACVAYDGKQVYATPRAISAFMTQTNVTDLSRRSPSYENRLSKYSRRGFEVYCPTLDRSRVDPTIFERSFGRVLGLARLLVLEKLPTKNDREKYVTKRREERGRPALPWRYTGGLFGNIKDEQPDEVSEWDIEHEDVSNYHTFTVPYGPKFHAKKIEKLLFTKDLLLNAEWNKPKDRTVNLHRHPAFFGRVQDVFGDCCGFCPEPIDEEDVLLAEKEAEIYIRGPIKFIVDNPGRQQIGSFNPLTEDDWTELAYVNSTGRLCQAISDGELDHVRSWCEQPDADVNCRDHTGRTPLQLATMCSTPAIVQCLIDAGARITARLYDGKTALHIAAQRGNVAMVKALIQQSEKNEEDEDRRQTKRKERVRAEQERSAPKAESEGSEEELSEGSDEDDSGDEMTQGSYVRVKSEKSAQDQEDGALDEDESPDYFDANVLAWDYGTSPLHMAIISGHIEVVRELVDNFGADVLLPVKIKDAYSNDPKAAILTLVLAARFSPNPPQMAKELLQRGASSSQADMHEISALHYIVHGGNHTVLDMLIEYDAPAAKAAINHVSVRGSTYRMTLRTPLLTAIDQRDFSMAKKLLENGASVVVPYDTFVTAYHRNIKGAKKDYEQMKRTYESQIHQPLVCAIDADLPKIAQLLIEHGADINSLSRDAHIALMKEKPHLYGGQWNPMRARSILEMTKYRLKKLREAVKTGGPIPELTGLKNDEYYMDEIEPSSYSEWAARTDLERAKQVLELLKEKREKEVKNKRKSADAHEEEMKKACDDFEELEKLLSSSGAKSFDEMYPESGIDRSSKRNQHGYYNSYKRKYEGPYETKFNFQVPNLSGPRRQGYIALFEAAWSGDTDRVKALTLSTWSPELVGAEGAAESTIDPLLISAQDSRGFTPLAIAIARGHMVLADVMLDIAMVQYQPEDKQLKYRYTLEEPEEYDSDEDSGASEPAGRDEDVTVHKHLIDKKFTVDNVAALKDTVGSKTTPRSLLGEIAHWFRFIDSIEAAKRIGIATPGTDLHTDWGADYENYSQGHLCAVLEAEKNRSRSSAYEYAIFKNDLPLLTWLMDREAKYSRLEDTKEEEVKSYNIKGIDRHEMNLCMRLGRTEMIGEIIKRTGMRLPLKSMVEKSGVEVKDKPKFYQGLTVYGRKRKDWADRSRGVFTHLDTGLDTPPLLDAAFNGTVETVEYFLGDAPLRRYEEFVANHPEDDSLEALRKEKGGSSRAISRWLNTRSQLALHGAVMAPPDKNREKLEFLIHTTPQNIEGLNVHRMTPLLLAFRDHRYEAARLLIKANANQAARDDRARNVLHQFMTHTFGQHRKDDYQKLAFEAFIKLLDPTLPHDLLTQRSSADTDSHTPLSYFIRHASYHKAPAFLETILHYSKGKDLELMDSTGDYPLHYVVRHGMSWAVKVFVDYNPALLHRESAVGLTPLDVAEIASLNQRIDKFDQLPYMYSDPWNQALTKSRNRGGRTGNIVIENLVKTSKICNQAVIKHPGSRKLVSLFDANEVAKRLAANAKPQQKRTPAAIAAAQKYDYNQTVEEEKKDEVDDWGRLTGRWKPSDLLKHLGLKEEVEIEASEDSASSSFDSYDD